MNEKNTLGTKATENVGTLLSMHNVFPCHSKVVLRFFFFNSTGEADLLQSKVCDVHGLFIVYCELFKA